MGPLNLTPPVDESIAALAERTAVIGQKILLEHGAKLNGDVLVIPTQQPGTQEPELFKLADLTQWWNPDWTLERAGFGGAGGGLTGIRGDTYLEGETVAVWPRDEVRGALLRRSIELGDSPSLKFDVAADAGRTWHLVVFVNNDKLLDRLIEGDPLTAGNASERHWEPIHLDLSSYKGQPVVVRLYDLVLVPNRYAGNSYWRHIELQ
jgi:hypothetical protein